MTCVVRLTEVTTHRMIYNRLEAACVRRVFDADSVAVSVIENYVTWKHELFVYLSIHGKHDHLMFAIYIKGSKKMIIV